MFHSRPDEETSFSLNDCVFIRTLYEERTYLVYELHALLINASTAESLWAEAYSCRVVAAAERRELSALLSYAGFHADENPIKRLASNLSVLRGFADFANRVYHVVCCARDYRTCGPT
jgi:hypothetical protein